MDYRTTFPPVQPKQLKQKEKKGSEIVKQKNEQRRIAWCVSREFSAEDSEDMDRTGEFEINNETQTRWARTRSIKRNNPLPDISPVRYEASAAESSVGSGMCNNARKKTASVKAGVYGVRHKSVPGVVHFDISWNLDNVAEKTLESLDDGSHQSKPLASVITRRKIRDAENRKEKRLQRKRGASGKNVNKSSHHTALLRAEYASTEDDPLELPFEIFVVRSFEMGHESVPERQRRAEVRDLEAVLKGTVTSLTNNHKRLVLGNFIRRVSDYSVRFAFEKWNDANRMFTDLVYLAAAVMIQGQGRRVIGRNCAIARGHWLRPRNFVALWVIHYLQLRPSFLTYVIVKIQRHRRGYLGRKKARRFIRRVIRRRAAVEMQRIGRGWSVRRMTSPALDNRRMIRGRQKALRAIRGFVRLWHRVMLSRKRHLKTEGRLIAVSRLVRWWIWGTAQRRQRRRTAATLIQKIWRGFVVREFGLMYWHQKRVMEQRVRAASVICRCARVLISKARESLRKQAQRRAYAACLIQGLYRGKRDRQNVASLREEALITAAALTLSRALRAWLVRVRLRIAWLQGAEDRVRMAARIAIKCLVWRKRSRLKMKAATVLRTAFKRCALCLTQPREWYHDATSEFLCSICLTKTEHALGEEDSFAAAEARAEKLLRESVRQAEIDALAAQRWGSFSPPPKPTKIFVKPAPKPFKGLAPMPVADHARIVTAVATLQRVWEIREESHCWLAGEFDVEINLWESLGMAMAADGTVTGVTRGGQADVGGIAPGCKIVGVKSNPPSFSETTIELGTNWSRTLATMNDMGGWGVGVDGIMSALQRCTNAEHETAIIVALDQHRGRCEVIGCRRSVKSVFRSTAPTMMKSQTRAPRVLRTCLHCAAVLRDEYVPNSAQSSGQSLDAVLESHLQVTQPTMLNTVAIAEETSLLDGATEEFVQSNDGIPEGTEASSALLWTNNGSTNRDMVAINTDLGTTGSALGYFRSKRMWVSVDEYALELKSAARICGFIWFTVRRYRWKELTIALTIKRNWVATKLGAHWRGRVMRATLLALRMLDNLVLGQVVPRLLLNKQFISPPTMTLCFAAPLMYRPESHPPFRARRKTETASKLPSSCVGAFLFDYQGCAARLLAPRLAGGSALRIPLKPEGGELITKLTRDAAGELLARATMKSYRCKQGWKALILMKRQRAWAWLKYAARSQWAACYIQTIWRGICAREKVSIIRAHRRTAWSVADIACDVVSFMNKWKREGWFSRSSGVLGSVDISPATLLSVTSFSPGSKDQISNAYRFIMNNSSFENAALVKLRSPGPSSHLFSSSYPFMRGCYSPPPTQGAYRLFPDAVSAPSVFFKVHVSRTLEEVKKTDHRLISQIIVRHDHIRQRIYGDVDGVNALAGDNANRLVPLVAERFRKWFMKVRGSMRSKGSSGSLEEFTLEAAAACVDAIRRCQVGYPLDNEHPERRRVPKVLKQCALEVHTIMIAHRRERMRLPLPKPNPPTVDEATLEMVYRARDSILSVARNTFSNEISHVPMYLRVELLSCDVVAAASSLSEKRWRWSSKTKDSVFELPHQEIEMNLMWCGKSRKCCRLHQNQISSNMGDRVQFTPRGQGKEVCREVACFKVPHSPPDTKAWLDISLNLQLEEQTKDQDTINESWSLSERDIWHCLLTGAAASFRPNNLENGSTIKLLVTVEPTPRTQSRLLCEGIVGQFVDDLFTRLPERPNMWSASIDPFDCVSQSMNQEKIQRDSLFTDSFATKVKLEIVDLVHDDNGSNQPALTMRDLFCVVKHRGSVAGVVDSHRPWKAGLSSLPIVRTFGMGGSLLPKPEGPLPFRETVGLQGEAVNLVLSLPCPQWKADDIEHELEKDDDSVEEEIVENVSTIGVTNADLLSVAIGLKSSGVDADDDSQTSTSGMKSKRVRAAQKNMKRAPISGWEQLVVEVYSRRPEGALFRGAVPMPYGELGRLCSHGYGRFPLRRRPVDSARGVRVRILFTHPKTIIEGTVADILSRGDIDSNELQMRTTLPSRTSRALPCPGARPLPSSTSWDGLISTATRGVRKSTETLDSAWAAHDGADVNTTWADEQAGDERIGQEDICEWGDAATVDMPLRTFLLRLGLNRFLEPLQTSEHRIMSAKQLEGVSDHEIQEAVTDFVARKQEAEAKVQEQESKKVVIQIVEENEDEEDDSNKASSGEIPEESQAIEQPMVVSRPDLTKIRLALLSMGPRVHNDDNPTAVGQAPGGRMARGPSFSANMTNISNQSRQTKSSKSIGSNTASSSSGLNEMPHLDARVLITQLWADLERPHQVTFTVNLSCIRDPIDVAEPPPIAVHNFCNDKKRKTNTQELGAIPPLSLSTLMEVYQAQTRHPVECRDGAEPPRFWVPVIEKPLDTVASSSSSFGSFEAHTKFTTPLSSPREYERAASESRMILGMWVRFTKRIRPSHLPVKGEKPTPVVEEVQAPPIAVDKDSIASSKTSRTRGTSNNAAAAKKAAKARKPLRKGLVVVDKAASLEDSEEVEPLDLDTEASLMGIRRLLKDPRVRVRVELHGLQYRVIESPSSCVVPPSEEALRHPECWLPVPAHAIRKEALGAGEPLDSCALLGLRATELSNPYKAASMLQSSFRGFKQRSKWKATISAEKRQKSLAQAREKLQQKLLLEEINKAETAAVAATAFQAGEASSALMFRGRMIDALKATVAAAEAEEKKAYAELQYEPNNRDRVLVHRLTMREVERAKRWLATNVESSMDPSDLLNSALERFAILTERVTNSRSNWEDLPPTLGYEMNEVLGMLSKAAVKGSGGAWDAMAHIHSSGKGDAPNEARAVDCWRKAAELGHATSMCSLAQHLHEGNGVTKNQKEGTDLYRQSAELGHVLSQYKFALALLRGTGCRSNKKLAVSWLRRAAEKDDPASLFMLGKCLFNGEGCKKDTDEAGKVWRIAASLGHAEAATAVAKDLEEEALRLEQASAVAVKEAARLALEQEALEEEAAALAEAQFPASGRFKVVWNGGAEVTAKVEDCAATPDEWAPLGTLPLGSIWSFSDTEVWRAVRVTPLHDEAKLQLAEEKVRAEEVKASMEILSEEEQAQILHAEHEREKSARLARGIRRLKVAFKSQEKDNLSGVGWRPTIGSKLPELMQAEDMELIPLFGWVSLVDNSGRKIVELLEEDDYEDDDVSHFQAMLRPSNPSVRLSFNETDEDSTVEQTPRDEITKLLPESFDTILEERSIFMHICSAERIERGRGFFGLDFTRRDEISLKVSWGGKEIGTVPRRKAAVVYEGTGLSTRSALAIDWRVKGEEGPSAPSSVRFVLPVGIADLGRKKPRDEESEESEEDSENCDSAEETTEASLTSSQVVGGAPPDTLLDDSSEEEGDEQWEGEEAWEGDWDEEFSEVQEEHEETEEVKEVEDVEEDTSLLEEGSPEWQFREDAKCLRAADELELKIEAFADSTFVGQVLLEGQDLLRQVYDMRDPEAEKRVVRPMPFKLIPRLDGKKKKNVVHRGRLFLMLLQCDATPKPEVPDSEDMDENVTLEDTDSLTEEAFGEAEMESESEESEWSEEEDEDHEALKTAIQSWGLNLVCGGGGLVFELNRVKLNPAKEISEAQELSVLGEEDSTVSSQTASTADPTTVEQASLAEVTETGVPTVRTGRRFLQFTATDGGTLTTTSTETDLATTLYRNPVHDPLDDSCRWVYGAKGQGMFLVRTPVHPRHAWSSVLQDHCGFVDFDLAIQNETSGQTKETFLAHMKLGLPPSVHSDLHLEKQGFVSVRRFKLLPPPPPPPRQETFAGAMVAGALEGAKNLMNNLSNLPSMRNIQTNVASNFTISNLQNMTTNLTNTISSNVQSLSANVSRDPSRPTSADKKAVDTPPPPKLKRVGHVVVRASSITPPQLLNDPELGALPWARSPVTKARVALSFTVLSCTGLPSVDSIKGECSDTYVVVSWCNRKLGQSRVQYREVDPCYDFATAFTINRSEWDAAVEEFNSGDFEDEEEDEEEKEDNNISPPPTLLEHLEALFHKYDTDDTGELEWNEFWHVLNDLNFGLTDKDIGEWQQFADADDSGSVRWSEFQEVGAQLLHQFAPYLHLSDDPWRVMADPVSGRRYRLNCITGVTEWIATAADKRREELEKTAKLRRDRVPPPVVIKVMHFNPECADNVVGVVIVPFETLIRVRPEGADATLTYSLKPWDPNLWLDGNPSKADFRCRFPHVKGSPLGKLSLSFAQVSFLGPKVLSDEVNSLEGPAVVKTLADTPVIRRVRLEVLGLEVSDVLGLKRDVDHFVNSVRPRTAAAVATHKSDSEHMRNSALRRTLFSHDPEMAKSSNGASCSCRIQWQGATSTMLNIPYWWSGASRSREGGHSKAFILKLPLCDPESSLKLDFDLLVGDSYLGGLDIDWTSSLKYALPLYRTTIDQPLELTNDDESEDLLSWGARSGLNGPVSEHDSSLRYHTVTCAELDEEETKVSKLFRVALLSPVDKGKAPSSAFKTGSQKKKGVTSRPLSLIGLGKKNVEAPQPGCAHIRFSIMRAHELIVIGAPDCFAATEVVNMSSGRPLSHHRAKTGSKKTLAPIWDAGEVEWKDVALESGRDFGLRVSVFPNKSTKVPCGVCTLSLKDCQGGTGARWFELIPVTRARGGIFLPQNNSHAAGFVKFRASVEFGVPKEPDVSVSRILPHVRLHFRMIVEECRPVSSVGAEALKRAKADAAAKKRVRHQASSEIPLKLPPLMSLSSASTPEVTARMRLMVHSVVKAPTNQMADILDTNVRVTAEWCGEELEKSFDFCDSPPPPAPPDLVAYFKYLFQMADKDSSGFLTKDELEAMLMKMDLGLSETDVNVVMQAADSDGDGKIYWLEFVCAAERVVRCILQLKAWGQISVTPWVRLKSKLGEYYYNRMNGESEWANPADRSQMQRMCELAPASHLEKPPSVLTNLKRLFRQYDTDGSGELEWEEFWHVLNDMGLGLTDKDIAEWQTYADVDKSGTVRWSEFEPMGAEMLKMFGESHDWTTNEPWVLLKDAGGNEYRYNRQTGEAEWVDTQDTRLVETAPADSAFVPPPPSLISRLKSLFQQYDTDGSGELEWEEFWHVLNDMGLGLTDKDIGELQLKADVDGSGTVRFHEFSRVGVPLLKEFMAKKKNSAWVVLETTEGGEYFFNNQSGESVWASSASDELKETVFGPPQANSIIVYHLKSLFQQYDTDGSGELEWEEFWHVLNDMGLGLTDKDITEWQTYADADGSGSVKWAEFSQVAGSLFKQLYKPQNWSLKGNWIKLIEPGGNPYRYNKETGESEWIDHQPPTMRARLKSLFQQYDTDGSGELEWEEFWHVLNDMGLGLTDKDIAEWQEAADADGSGTVKWSEFSPMADKLIKTSAKGHDWKKEDPWVEMDAGGHPYRYNRDTGDSEWIEGRGEENVDKGENVDLSRMRDEDHGLFIVPLPEHRISTRLVLKCWKGDKMVGGSLLEWPDIERLVGGRCYRSDYDILSTQDYLAPPTVSGVSKAANCAPLVGGHFSNDRVGMIDLEVLQPIGTPMQQVSGLCICISGTIEESAVAAPHSIRVDSQLLVNTLPPARRLGSTRWPGDDKRIPVLSGFWRDSFGQHRIGSDMQGPDVLTPSSFRYGNSISRTTSTGLLQDTIIRLKNSYTLPSSLLDPTTDGHLRLVVTDLGQWRQDEIVYLIRLQRWYLRTMRDKKYNKCFRAVLVLQKAFRSQVKRLILSRAFKERKKRELEVGIATFSIKSVVRRQEEAARRIQKQVKKYLRYRRAVVLEKDRELMGEHQRQRVDAATMISKRYRGFVQRRKHLAKIKEIRKAEANTGFAQPGYAFVVIRRFVRLWYKVRQARLKAEALAKQAAEAEAVKAARILASQEALKDTSDDITRPVVEGDFVLWVVEGKDLPNVDSFGKSDPYVRVRYNGVKVGATKVMNNNLNPKWYHKFVFPAPNPIDLLNPTVPWGRLVLDVLDKDSFGEDDFMGRIVIDSWQGLRELQRATVRARVKDKDPFTHFAEDAHVKDEQNALRRLVTLYPLCDKHDDDLMHELSTPRVRAEGEEQEEEDRGRSAAAAARRGEGDATRYFKVKVKKACIENLAKPKPKPETKKPETKKDDPKKEPSSNKLQRQPSVTASAMQKLHEPPFLSATGLWTSTQIVASFNVGGAPVITTPQSAKSTKQKLATKPKGGKGKGKGAKKGKGGKGKGKGLKGRSELKKEESFSEDLAVVSWADEVVSLIVSEHFLATTPLTIQVALSSSAGAGRVLADAQLDLSRMVPPREDASSNPATVDEGRRTLRLKKPGPKPKVSKSSLLGSILKRKPVDAATAARRAVAAKPRMEVGLLRINLSVEQCSAQSRKELSGFLGLAAFIDNSAQVASLKKPEVNKDTRTTMVEETKQPTTLVEHIQYLFQAADKEKSGKLTLRDFRWLMVGVGLGVTGDDVEDWIEEIDIDDEGITWEDFETDADEYISMLLQDVEWEDPWIEITAQGRRSFLYNRETNESKWCDEEGFWVEIEDEEGCQCWYNEVTQQTTYEDPTLDQPQTGWVETEDEEGNQCWQHQETEEITYEDPTGMLSTDGSRWIETVDEEEYQCWYNEETGETSYEDPNLDPGDWTGTTPTGWTETFDENGYQCWYNEETGETSYEDPNLDPGDWTGTTPTGWTETVDENGYQCWKNEETGETSYEDPNFELIATSEISWQEMVDENGSQYWYNEGTGESSYEDPFAETARTVTAVAEQSIDTLEVAQYVSTNAKGNRIFSLRHVSSTEQEQLMEIGAVSPYDSLQDCVYADGSTEGDEGSYED